VVLVTKKNSLQSLAPSKENKGLEYLTLRRSDFTGNANVECWDSVVQVCDSLKTHATLQVLNLGEIHRLGETLTPAVPRSRIQPLVDMMKVNMSIHTIHLDSLASTCRYTQYIWIPLLTGNTSFTERRSSRISSGSGYSRMPSRKLAQLHTVPRALLAVRSNRNRFWMLLSGNAEIAFPSKTTTIAIAANLPPAPATVGASANAATVVAKAVATVTPAVNVATPSSGQKR
jgi:hypothetical protein